MTNVTNQVDFLVDYLDHISKVSHGELEKSQLRTHAAYYSGRLDLAIDLLGLVRKLERAISVEVRLDAEPKEVENG